MGQIYNSDSIAIGGAGGGSADMVTSVNGETGDVVITSQDIFNNPTDIGDAEDLNSYITPGLYVQEELGWATNGLNYPEPQPGALTVIDAGNGNVIQTYINYFTTKAYKRAFRNNEWTVWYALYDEYNKPPEQIVPALGQPGSMGFFTINSNTITSVHPGDTVAGSALQFAGINDGSGLIQGYANRSVAGTWEVRGNFLPTPQGSHCASMLIRIDGTNLMAMQQFQPTTRLLSVSRPVRNCQYAAPDNSLIYCEVLVSGIWYPFTASLADGTTWGPAIYNAAVAGQYGEVIDYQG